MPVNDTPGADESRAHLTRRRLLTAFLVPLGVAMVCVAAVGIAALSWMERDEANDQAETTNRLVARMYQEEMLHDAETLHTAIDMVRNLPTVGDAFARGDRAALLAATAPLLAQLREQLGVTHFYFHGPDRVNLLRVHQPDRFGDRIDRFTTVQAQRTQSPVWGLELGPLGTLTLRMVAPWPGPSGETVGYVELGMEIDRVLDHIRRVLDVDMPLWLRKNLISRGGWEAGMWMMGRKGADWDAYPGVVLSGQSHSDLPARLLERAFDETGVAARSIAYDVGGNQFLGTPLPLTDVTGAQVGWMIVVSDVTAVYHADTVKVFVAGAVALLVAALLALFFRWRIGMVARTLTHREEQVTHLATRDPLTGLVNRAGFLERLARALGEGPPDDRRTAVLVLDLDRFKSINDSLGHTVGDLVLKEVVARIAGVVREGDTLARLEGDEFAILAQGLKGEDTVEALAERVIHVTDPPIEMGASTLRLSCSVGVARAPEDGGDALELLRKADVAMHQAKAAGRGRYSFFAAEMGDRVAERMRLESAIHAALAQGQFQLYYQPQVGTRSRGIIGAEALIRWIHPEWGLIRPDRFVPILEETGLIREVGLWVIKQACRDAQAWNPAMRVAVNLSPVQLADREFIGQVRTILDQQGMPPERLEFEITESILMERNDTVIANLGGIRELGIPLALDDFGTGYSSLSYLKHLPASVLKLDKSLVDDLGVDDAGSTIIEGMIWMAHALGMTVVAEGVETAPQLRALVRYECDVIQGYLFSGPLPMDAFDRYHAGFSWEAHLPAAPVAADPPGVRQGVRLPRLP
ncbi:MAG: EAL domain-containing protein [Nitrospirae bacterium]|nr:EAL domain-containing protein [Nitrospirota bacterium]